MQINISKNTRVTGEFVRGIGLSIVFPMRRMGYEPIVMVQVLWWLFCWGPKTRKK